MAELDRANRTLPRKLAVSAWDDKSLFAAVLIGGVAGMFVLWSLDQSQLVVTAWPLACLCFYAGVLFVTKRYQLREDRAGDNLYYLGFLYTLASLGHALYVFADNDGGSDQIVTDFGIALWTTIVGLALRVFFNQWRADPVESEREVRLELNRTVQALVDDMSRMRTTVNGYTKQVEQSIEEVHVESRTAIEENIRNTTESYRNTVANLDAQIKSSTSTLATSTSQFTSQLSSASDALLNLENKVAELKLDPDLFERVLRGSVEPIASAAQEFRGKLLNVRFDEDMIERAITRPFENFSEAVHQLNDLHLRQAKMIESLESTVESAAEGARGVRTALGEISNFKLPEDAISNAIEPAYRQMHAYIAGLQSYSESDRERLEALNRTISGLSEQISSLDGAFSSVLGAGNAISSMHSAFNDIADSIKNTTNEVSEAVDRHTEVVGALNINVEQTTSRLKKYAEEMDQELEAVRKANQKVFSELAELAETVVNRL